MDLFLLGEIGTWSGAVIFQIHENGNSNLSCLTPLLSLDAVEGLLGILCKLYKMLVFSNIWDILLYSDAFAYYSLLKKSI